MHTHLMSLYKKITAVIILILFSFVLLTPTVNALNYDPKLRKTIIKPNGDGDPWEVERINDPPTYFYSSIIYYFNLFIIKTLEKPHIINIEKEQYSGRQTPSSAPIGSK